MIISLPSSFKVTEIPTRWSYSNLRDFEICPLRWKLLNSKFAKENSKILRTKSLSSVKGDLVHELLETYASTSKSELFKPRQVLKKLKNKYVEEKLIESERYLAAKISLSSILMDFNKAKNSFDVQRSGINPTRVKSASRNIVNGVEKWLVDKDSGLCGVVDYFKGGILVDYKSGLPQKHHQQQLFFYIALLSKINGKPPREAKLVYSSTGQKIEVDIPTNSGLSELISHYLRVAKKIKQGIERNDFEANPIIDVCKICPARILCISYWRDIVPDLATNENNEYVDVSSFETGELQEKECYTILRSKTNGHGFSIIIPHNIVPKDSFFELNPTFFRFQNARRRGHESGNVQFVITNKSKIYYENGQLSSKET